MAGVNSCCEVDIAGSSRGLVDRLTEAVGEVRLTSDGEIAVDDRTHEDLTPCRQAMRGLRSRPEENKENKEGDEVTPSRLACFKQLRDELTCAVCLDVCVRPCTTPCGHNYCRSCLRRNTELNRPCPKCRALLPPGFTLNINTTLWNTIQHLFPADASSKPLTPPPAQLQQPVASYRQHTRQTFAVNSNPAAAPFRPPRFVPAAVAAGVHGQLNFNGESSSRANSAGMAGWHSIASLAGRSVSGPRPQRLLSSSLGSGAGLESSAPQPQRWTAGPQVFSLAELGVRPRVGDAAQRNRRRSRSAERWEASEPLLLSSEEEVALAQRQQQPVPPGGASIRANSQPNPQQPSSSSSGLLQVLSGTSRSGAAAAIGAALTAGWPTHAPGRARSQAHAENTGDASAAASRVVTSVHDAYVPIAAAAASVRNLSSNPFLRPRRPPAGPPIAANPLAAAMPDSTTEGTRSVATMQAPGCHRSSEAYGSFVAGGHFTASQRVLLNACTTAQPSSGARAEPSRAGDTGLAFIRTTRGESGIDAVAERPAAPVPRVGSGTSQSSATSGSTWSTLGTLGSGLSAQVTDELELLPEAETELQPCGGEMATLASGLGVTAQWRAEVDSAMGARGQSSVDDTRERSTTTRFVLMARATADLHSGGVQPSSGAGPIAVRESLPLQQQLTSSLLSADSGGDVRLEELENSASASLQRMSTVIAASPLASPFPTAPDLIGPSGSQSSPSWSELDAVMARALEPLHISLPGLPRLRVPQWEGAPAPVSSHPPLDGATAAGSNSITPRVRTSLDPDLAENYDGEDPAGADMFFSSPFFDVNLLRESLLETEADGWETAMSGVDHSPRWRRADLSRDENTADRVWIPPVNCDSAPLDMMHLPAGFVATAAPVADAMDRREVPQLAEGDIGASAVPVVLTCRGAPRVISPDREMGALCGTARSQLHAGRAGRSVVAQAPAGRELLAGDDRYCPIDLRSDSD